MKPTEYTMLKRTLSNKCADSTDHTQTDANTMIRESVENAYYKLSIDDRAKVELKASVLRARCPKLSPVGALEVLAAVGQYLSEKETK